MSTIDFKTLSEAQKAELKKQLFKEEQAAEKKRLAEKKQYEQHRHKSVLMLADEAESMHTALATFKDAVARQMDEHATRLQEYGGIRSNSKGGFSITDDNENYRIVRTRDTQPHWDERSEKGFQMIADYLESFIKKRSNEDYNFIKSLLTRDKEGKISHQNAMLLIQHEDNYKEDLWREGVRLVKEGYKIILNGYGYYFQRKGADGKWDTLTLNFSSL